MDSFIVNFVPWNQRNSHGELYLPGSVPTKEGILVSGWNHAQMLAPVGYGVSRSEDSAWRVRGAVLRYAKRQRA